MKIDRMGVTYGVVNMALLTVEPPTHTDQTVEHAGLYQQNQNLLGIRFFASVSKIGHYESSMSPAQNED